MRIRSRTPFAFAAGLALIAVSPDGVAQARRFTGRLSLGVAPPALTGLLHDGPIGAGFAGSFAVELRPVAALGIELDGGYAVFPVIVPTDVDVPAFASDASLQLGLRLHPISGLYLGASGGVHSFLRELRFGGAAELGFDLAVTPGFSVGIFGRCVLLAPSDNRATEAWLVFGLTFALGSPIAPIVSAPTEGGAAPEPRAESAPSRESASEMPVRSESAATPASDDSASAAATDATTTTTASQRHHAGHARHRPHHRAH